MPKKINILDEIRNGHLDNVKAYIINGSGTINERGSRGDTLLYHAIINHQSHIALWLITQNALIEEKSEYGGFTPLHVAIATHENRVVECLINHQADVNAISFEGLTPLHFAVRFANSFAISALIASKANVDAKTNSGCTPLHAGIFPQDNYFFKYKTDPLAAIDTNIRILQQFIHEGKPDLSVTIIQYYEREFEKQLLYLSLPEYAMYHKKKKLAEFIGKNIQQQGSQLPEEQKQIYDQLFSKIADLETRLIAQDQKIEQLLKMIAVITEKKPSSASGLGLFKPSATPLASEPEIIQESEIAYPAVT